MTREIPVYIDATHPDPDTKVGFGFQSKLFFVDNKETRTTREDSQDILNVLTVVTNGTPYTLVDNQLTLITKTMLDNLASTLETVNSISYTYEDSGAFIKTIAFNDYDYYPLVIDCPLKKLYIMNTDKVYDLSLNLDPSYIIDDLISFYTLTLGLDMPVHLMEKAYEVLTGWYTPKVYNHIASREDREETLYYNNQISLSNYEGSGLATYTCTLNPSDEPAYTKLGDIVGLDVDSRTISLINCTTPLTTFPLTKDTSIYIDGLSETSGADTYTADGKYTWASTDLTNNKVTVAEHLSFEYKYPYPKVYWESSRTTITSISNPSASIVVSSASGFNVGDTLTITGSYKKANDGNYEIIGINGTTITFSSVPPVSMTSNCGVATVLTYLGDVVSIAPVGTRAVPKTSVTLKSPSPVTLTAGNRIKVGDNFDCTVSTMSEDLTIINIADIIDSYTPTYPTLSYNSQAPTVGINVTSSDTEKLPVGEFIVDTHEQCLSYIGLGISVPLPTEALNTANLKVPTTDTLTYDSIEIPMSLKGLYSEIYS